MARKKKQNLPVLVACPTYAGKQYCLDEYIDAYNAFDYEPKTLFMVDNTRYSQGYFELIASKGVEVAHLNPLPKFQDTFAASWQVILDYALEGNFAFIFSVEQDNIVPPEVLPRFVGVAEDLHAHVVTHTYHLHESACEASGVPYLQHMYRGLGCTLLTVGLVREALAHWKEYGMFETAMWTYAEAFVGSNVTMQGVYDIRHRDGFEMEFWQFEVEENPVGTCPTPRGPDNTSSIIPPSIESDVNVRRSDTGFRSTLKKVTAAKR